MSKSHIQGHPKKVENKSFHFTPSLMGFQAFKLDLLAPEKCAILFGRPCMYDTYSIGPASGEIH